MDTGFGIAVVMCVQYPPGFAPGHSLCDSLDVKDSVLVETEAIRPVRPVYQQLDVLPNAESDTQCLSGEF